MHVLPYTFVKTSLSIPTHSFRFGVSLALLLGVLLTPLVADAQADAPDKASRFNVSGLWGGWHTQLTSLQGEEFLQGGYGGVEFNKVIFVGWGLYKLQGQASYELPNDALLPVDLRYHGPMVEYTPHARKVLHPKFGLHTGFGRVNRQGVPEDRIFLLQPSVGGELNLLRWARLGIEVGYRLALGVEELPNLPGQNYLSGEYAQASIKFGFSWGSKNEPRRSKGR